MRVRQRIRSGEEEGVWPRVIKVEGCTSCASCGNADNGHAGVEFDHIEWADVDAIH